MTDTLELQRARNQADFRARLPSHIERLNWNAERIAAHQARVLRSMLGEARARSPFYARRLAGHDLERFAPADLDRLPTLGKDEMMASYDDLVTDRRVTRAAVEDLLARTTDQPELLAGEYLCLASGGSSGLRGIYAWHWQDVTEFSLAVLRTALARAAAAGGPPPGGIVTAMVGASSAVHATRGVPMLLTGDLVHFNSVLGRLAAEKRAGRLQISPFAISGIAEPFPPELRAEIEQAFGCPVTDSFASTEGLIGASLPGELPITLASDLAIVEFVDERIRPVPAGEPSARVLLTTLYNRVQPLIRYELTDRMRQHPPSPAHGHLRVTVDGRSDDVFVYGERTLHPLTVRSVFVKTPEVSEYRVQQTPTGIAVDFVPTTTVDAPALAARLRRALEEAGLPAPSATLREVPRIERHAETGKVRRFLPLA
jgi:phenylacetate-coenzyme A ligase PaaK-like adenylate-forming protein